MLVTDCLFVAPNEIQSKEDPSILLKKYLIDKENGTMLRNSGRLHTPNSKEGERRKVTLLKGYGYILDN